MTVYVCGQLPVVVHDNVRFSDILPLFWRMVPVVLRLVAPVTLSGPKLHVATGAGSVANDTTFDVAELAPA